MVKKLLCLITFSFFIIYNANGQCAAIGNNACTQAAPTVINNSITCTTPNNQGGRRNFQVTNMIAGATYRVSNCGSGIDTQMTIRDSGGVSVGYNDDNGPDCFGTSASIDFVPPATGTFRIQLNKYNCATSPNSSNGDIVVTLLSNPSTPATNDLCANATPLPCGTTNLAGTTNGTTNIINSTGCFMSNYGVWYTFTGDGDQTTIDVSGLSLFDIEVAIESGSCGSLTNLNCEDTGNPESYTFTTVNGTDYYVYVGYWTTGSSTGNFTISRSCTTAPTAPVNDLCANATPLPCGTTNLAGSTINSSNITNTTACFMSNYGVWYTFTGDGDQTTIDVSGLGGFDIEVAIESGSCGSFTNLNCEDSGNPESYTFNTINGIEYYVYVGYWTSGSTTGNFTISRSCTIAPPDPCDSAISLPCGTSNLAGTTVGSTTTPSGIGCGSGDNGAWYTFVGDGLQTTISSTAAAGFDHEMAIASGMCGLFTNITCQDSAFSGGTETYTFITTNGINYYVYIADWLTGSTNTGNFTLTRTCTTPPPPPPNDEPCTATALIPNGTCIPTSGTLEAATDSGIDACFGTPDNDVWYSFVATNTSHTVTISNFAGSDTDMYHAVYGPIISPDDCNDVTVSNNMTCEDFNDYTDLVGLTVGATYYVQVFTYSGGIGTTTFDICVTEPCTNSNPINHVPTVCPLIAGELGVDPFVDPFDPDPSFSLDCTNPNLTLEAHSTIRTTESYIVEQIDYTFPNFTPTGFSTPQVIGTDDVWAASWTTLPFNFCFYGNTYTQALVGANGMITFDTSNIAGSSCGWQFDNNLPSTVGALFNNTIYGVYHDIDPTGVTNPTESWVEGSPGCQRFVTVWRDVPMFSDATVSREYTGMVVLHETTNIIEVFIQNKRIENGNVNPWNDGNAIVGLQGNASSGESITAPCRNGLDSNWEATNEAWRFVPNGTIIAPDLVEWFSASTGGSTVIGTGLTLPITTPDTYTAEVTYTSCGSSVTLSDDVVVNQSSKTWNGSVDTNWYVHANWTPPGAPMLTDCVLIPDVATTNNRSPIADNTNIPGTIPIPPILASALNLTVDPNGYIEIESGTNLQVVDWIQLDGTIDIRDTGSLIQVNEFGPNVNNNSGNGVINMERTVPGGVNSYDYVYWSSPTEDDFNVTDISSGTGELIYEWNPTLNGVTHGDWIPASGIMTKGKGYIVRGLISTAPVPANTAVFTGKPRNGVITVPITRGTYTAGPYAGPGDTMATALDDNWNLIGNPYPSAISYSSFISANPYIDGTIYFWTHQTAPSYQNSPFYYDFVYNYSDDYIDNNYTGSNPPTFNGDIAAGQAFFVLMRDLTDTPSTGVSEDVIFNNTMRHETLINSQFYRTNESNVTHYSEIERHRIWLDLINPNEIATSILVGYVEGATDGNDRLFDGYEFAGSAISFYSLIDEEKMSIQGKSLPFEVEDTVPLGMVIPEEGNYTIAINSLDGLFLDTNQAIYLEDTYNGIIYDLRLEPYSFNSESGIFDDRFILRYNNESLGMDEFNISNLEIIAPNNSFIKIKSGISDISSVTMYDLLGRVLIDKHSINNSEFILQTSNYSDGTYIVKAETNDGKQKIQKVVLKR